MFTAFYSIMRQTAFHLGAWFVQQTFHSCNTKGGERMSELALSLIHMVLGTIVKTITKAITKHVLSRFKDRTASIGSRDGSKSNTKK